MEENIKYYEIRIRFIKKLFKDHQINLLQKNKDKIKNLADEYNKFKTHQDYDPQLAEFAQTFIF